jgi:hypothetical protein
LRTRQAAAMLNGMTIRDQRLDARPPNQDLAGRAAAQLQRLLATLGWEVSYIDLDLTSDRPTAEVRLMRVDARRDNHNRKVFLLEDLSPNIIEIQEQLSDISPEILIKLSPLIDIQHLVSSLKNIYKIWIIAVKNEVKEVLVYLKKTENNQKFLA